MPPPGMLMGLVDAELTRDAADEARALLRSRHASRNAGCEACELHWSYISTSKRKRWELAIPVTECPHIIAFMDAAMRKVMPERYKSGGLLIGGDAELVPWMGNDGAAIKAPHTPRLGAGLKFLNVIVRRCAPGGGSDRILFHKDNDEFCDEVWAGVLDRDPNCNRLQYWKPDDSLYEVPEEPGLAHVIIDDARWVWQHGLPSMRGRQGERISISWRWYRKDFRRWWLDPLRFRVVERTCPSAGEEEAAKRLLRWCCPPPEAKPICQVPPPPPEPPPTVLPSKVSGAAAENVAEVNNGACAFGSEAATSQDVQSKQVSVGMALCDFDSEGFGDEYLPMFAGDLLEVHHTDVRDRRWAFGVLLTGSGLTCAGRRGWFPADRVRCGVWGKALANFDAKVYGEAYLQLTAGDAVQVNSIGKDGYAGWACGLIASEAPSPRLAAPAIIHEGWFPASYWQLENM